MTTNKLKLFSNYATDLLEENFEANLSHYCDSTSNYEWVLEFLEKCCEGNAFEYEIDIEIPGKFIEELGFDNRGNVLSQEHFALQLYEYFGALDADILLQPAFWCYVTHRYCQRWLWHFRSSISTVKVPKSYNFIPRKFPRSFHQCQIARFYMTVKWVSEFCTEFPEFTINDVLKFLLSDSDKFYQLSDRMPTASTNIRNTLIYILVLNNGGISRDEFRLLATYIDRLCGAAAIEILNPRELMPRLETELARLRQK